MTCSGIQGSRLGDFAIARTGLRDHEATGFRPVTVETVADDHKAYYPGARPIHIRLTGGADTGRLLGAQLVGHRESAVHKRVDIFATAIHHGMTVAEIEDLDLSYTRRWAARSTPFG
jgi:NADPH-dependent 2,4-dienoyl-CoA reductase/sulfur reductase-like enzyme